MNVVVDLDRPDRLSSAQIHPVILSGGAGTRLWPLSRAIYPKQLLALTSERTLLQETARRNAADAGFADPIVICNEEHRFLIEEQLRLADVRAQQVMLEPAGRNTGPATAAVALWLAERDPDALMLVQPSDHNIGAPGSLHAAVQAGIAAAEAGRIITFGVKPTRPEPGYGYIQAGPLLEGSDRVLAVDQFVEKPDRQTAQRFLDSGLFYWNSGIFLFSARALLDELRRLHPRMLEACARAISAGKEDLGFFRLDAAAFGEAPALSIDRAVVERTERAAVVPVEMDWSDLGSWQSLREIAPHDENGNVVQGDVIVDGVSNSYIRSVSRLIAVIGLDDVVVVSTDDAVLVARADRAGEVSGVVETLRKRNRSEPVQHTTCHRPWGYYRTIDTGDRFQVKRIMVKPGASLSLQKHFHRAEHWVVVHGTALVRRGEDTMLLHENESTYIPIGTAHRLENPGKLPLHLIEVQSGAYLGEDDIVRIADSYGRC
jgi:mannose-1-phosphate guanylyltransferase/mannose-6-phosphate isomerase